MSVDREQALDVALGQIERQFGKGAVMRLGEQGRAPIEVIPTGAISLDIVASPGTGRLVTTTDQLTGERGKEPLRKPYTPWLGRFLHVSPSEPIVVAKRLRLADRETMAIETLHVREALVPGLTRRDLEGRSFYELLRERYGIVSRRSPTRRSPRRSAFRSTRRRSSSSG